MSRGDGGAAIAVNAQITLTPEQLAAAYWELAADEQADYFAELYRLAGYKLCLQTAALFVELVKRSDRGDYAAAAGFRTMFYHAEDYPEAAAEWRANRAKHDIARLAERSKS